MHGLVSAGTTALDLADSHLSRAVSAGLREVDSLSEGTDTRIQHHKTFALRGAKVCKWRMPWKNSIADLFLACLEA